MSSFFSERTAEYALVPILQRSLESRFSAAIPIFYWKTREGNRVSSDVHRGRSVQLLAMFARRPKVTDQRNIIAGKINCELFEFSQAARSLGVLTIAGFPAVDSIHGLYSDPSILWLPLDSPYDGDCQFFVDLSRRRPKPIDGEGSALRTMSLRDISDQVEECSKTLAWDDAMLTISELRSENYRDDFKPGFPWFSGYKPVYFLVSRDV